MEKKLGELGDLIGGGTPASSNTTFWDGSIPWISSSDVDENNIHSVKITRFITEQAINNSSTKLCTAPVILIVSRVGVGKVAYSMNSLCTSQDFTNIINLKSNGLFLSYLLSIIMKKAASSAQGTSIKGISSSEIKSKKLYVPENEEQQKIALFLSKIDDRISTQNKIIQRLETLMQGLKERIFTKKIRFKDDNGEEFLDWEVKKLEKICEKQSSNISANKIEENFGEYPIYGATGVLKKVDFYEVENDYISIIKDGAGVGRLLYCRGKSSVLGTLDILKPKGVNLYFLYCLLSNIDFGKFTTGSTIPHIYFRDYKNEDCSVPSFKEQTRIADFLCSIDEKIETEKKILEQYENQKKYLLRNLFI